MTQASFDPTMSPTVEAEGVEALRHEWHRRYGIDGEFVSVPQMSRILGIGETTLYDYIRQGRFAVPSRMFNKSPRATVADFARWFLSEANVVLERSRVRDPIGQTDGTAAMPPHVEAAVAKAMKKISL